MKATDWKLGLSSCSTSSLDEQVFAQYSQHGIGVMEISLPTELYKTIRWNEIKQHEKNYQVEIRSIHLPYYPFETLDLSSFDQQIRKNAIDQQLELVSKASDIGIAIAVIHPSGEPYPDHERSERLLYAREALSILAEKAKQYGTTIAVENLPRTCLGNSIEEMQFLISDNDDLRICFDTNHLLKQNNSDFIRALGHQFINIHVSDYDFLDEKHWMPYEGKTNWVELVSLLEEVGYAGPFLYEISLKKPKTLDRRDLTFADFKVNYDCCVQKIPAPRII